MNALPTVTVRPAQPADLPGVAALIARTNAVPAGQSLHCAAASAAAVRAALWREDDFPGGWERTFALAATNDGEPAAALGCQVAPDGAFGWLWGPWVDDERRWNTPVPLALLDGLCARLPSSVRRLEAFLHVENRVGLRFLQARGFASGPVTHIYVARPTDADAGTGPLPDLGAAHEVAFGRLHADTFPAHGSAAADDLLAGRDDEHRIFAVTDGLRLLGYVCVSVNRAPLEGFVDYLAVRASARGRGLGARLLHAARRWAFEERRLPQLALCVSDWRAGARRLYEQTGFRLSASGVAARRRR